MDDAYPTQIALGLLTPNSHCVTKTLGAEAPHKGWVLHTGAKNVLVTHLAPLEDPRRGIRVRLLETEGRAATVRLAGWRPFASGQRTDLRQQPLGELVVDEERLVAHVQPFQWVQLEGYWTP